MRDRTIKRALERRDASAYRLRQYCDEIKALEAETDVQYMLRWLLSLETSPDAEWIGRETVLMRLKECAIGEAERLMAVLDAA